MPIKKLLLILTLLYAAAAWAAVDVNKASEAELDGVKGIGPGLSARILDERKNGEFKDWADLIARVGGVGEKTAARLSTEGLTVNGKKFSAAAAARAKAKADRKAEQVPPADKKRTAASLQGKEAASSAAASATQAPASSAPADIPASSEPKN